MRLFLPFVARQHNKAVQWDYLNNCVVRKQLLTRCSTAIKAYLQVVILLFSATKRQSTDRFEIWIQLASYNCLLLQQRNWKKRIRSSTSQHLQAVTFKFVCMLILLNMLWRYLSWCTCHCEYRTAYAMITLPVIPEISDCNTSIHSLYSVKKEHKWTIKQTKTNKSKPNKNIRKILKMYQTGCPEM